jgi:hypothetical protein
MSWKCLLGALLSFLILDADKLSHLPACTVLLRKCIQQLEFLRKNFATNASLPIHGTYCLNID